MCQRFQDYLTTHQLALIVSRDVTTRDHADQLQPYNLRIAGTSHETLGTGGKIYDVGFLQIFQADQLRSLNYGDISTPREGRRVLAQYLHDPAVDNPPVASSPVASVQLGADGSSAALVPARRALTWQLTDTNGVGVMYASVTGSPSRRGKFGVARAATASTKAIRPGTWRQRIRPRR